jgi:YbbR domain-containing protein
MALRPFRHLGLKLISIALAALIWLIVSGEQIVERSMRIPLEFVNLPERLELIGDAPTVVDVRVRGSSGTLGRIAAGELAAVVDLKTARQGRRLFHLTGADVRAPFGIEVVQVTPSNVSIQFEPSASKIVRIVAGVEGDPAPGFAVSTIATTPPTVEVVGPASMLASLSEAITEPVSVAGARSSVTETVTVGSPDPAVRLRSPQTARVTVTITAAPIEWTVAALPVHLRNATRPTQVAPEQVAVLVRGPREARAVAAAEFDASVNVEGLHPGEFDLPVRIVPPSKIGVVRVDPAQVRVRIR